MFFLTLKFKNTLTYVGTHNKKETTDVSVVFVWLAAIDYYLSEQKFTIEEIQICAVCVCLFVFFPLHYRDGARSDIVTPHFSSRTEMILFQHECSPRSQVRLENIASARSRRR